MSEYNDLISAELADTVLKLDTILQDDDSYNMRGVAAMLTMSGNMMYRMAIQPPTPADAMIVKACIEMLADKPGALALLLGQLGKGAAMMHMGFYEGRPK
jgi:hypothetical protein